MQINTLSQLTFLHLMYPDVYIHSIINNDMLPEYIRIKNISVDLMNNQLLFFKWFSEHILKKHTSEMCLIFSPN